MFTSMTHFSVMNIVLNKSEIECICKLQTLESLNICPSTKEVECIGKLTALHHLELHGNDYEIYRLIDLKGN
jgi:hypothetical protein